MLAMKLEVFCLFVVISVCVYAEQYTDKYDNIDVDAIINNERLLKRYTDCLMDRSSRCPPEALELKKHINEALENECAKCSERQKQMVRKVIRYLIEHKRDIWNELKAKYDPEGKYAKKYEDMAKEEGVQI